MCGILSPLLWLLLICIAGAIPPEPNQIMRFISELRGRRKHCRSPEVLRCFRICWLPLPLLRHGDASDFPGRLEHQMGGRAHRP